MITQFIIPAFCAGTIFVMTAVAFAGPPPCTTTELAILQPGGLIAGDEFGVDVSMQNNALLIGTSDESDTGSVYVYRFNPCQAAWSADIKLTASDGGPGDYFNSLAFAGNVAVVGAWGDSDLGPFTGSVYVFRCDGQSWAQEQKLLASDGEAGDYFGLWNAISGNWIAVGATNEDEAGAGAGAVYVFHRSGPPGSEVWTQHAKLMASDAQPDDNFGWPVLMNGNVLVVGAYGDDDLGNAAGAAYVFKFNGSSWIEQQKLHASDGGANDYFALVGAMDSERIVLGAGGDAIAGPDSGSAYVFRFDGSSWVEEAKLIPSDPQAAAEFGGGGLAIRDDVILAAAWLYDGAGTDSGAAYVFQRSGSTWTEAAKITASDAGESSIFGGWLALGENGMAVVGSRGHDAAGRDAGSAYLFGGIRDCNANGMLDLCDIHSGASQDVNKNGNPDECESTVCSSDLDGNGVINGFDLALLLGGWGPCQ